VEPVHPVIKSFRIRMQADTASLFISQMTIFRSPDGNLYINFTSFENSLPSVNDSQMLAFFPYDGRYQDAPILNTGSKFRATRPSFVIKKVTSD
jgi:hypothetical protein